MTVAIFYEIGIIPCNCANCKNSQNPHFYKYDKLKGWISNGRLKDNCDNYPYDEVDIRSLIDDVIDGGRDE
ncbi:MAG: hypothetical protein QNJ74_01935 [Trichodesmium sp. MO_231.B1]|nr:hypothetical protein [Trichodesmium sp. MO_231.B1]